MTDRAARTIAWTTSVVCCLYYGWSCVALWVQGAATKGMLEGLGTELPTTTRFVLGNQLWLFPFLFGGAALAVIGKEVVLRDKRLSPAITLAITLLVFFVVDWIKFVMLLPLITILNKLS